MIARAALIACVALSLALGWVAVLWQRSVASASDLERSNAALRHAAAESARARDIASERADRMADQLALHRAAIAALSSQEIPDADLDPAVIAVLCSVRPADRVCRGADPARAADTGR